MDSINKNYEMNEEIIKLNDDFGITRDGINLVALSEKQVSLQILNDDISGIMNFFQNTFYNDVEDEELDDIKPNKALLDERIKNFKLPAQESIKTESVDILEEKGPSCSKNNNEDKICDKKAVEEKDLLRTVESKIIKTSHTNSNPIKGKSLLNSSKNIVKSSTKTISLLKTNRNIIKTDSEIITKKCNKAIRRKFKEASTQTEFLKIEKTIDTLPELKIETNKSGSAIYLEAPQSSSEFKNQIKLEFPLNSSVNIVNNTVKLTTLYKSNKNLTTSKIDKTIESKPRKSKKTIIDNNQTDIKDDTHQTLMIVDSDLECIKKNNDQTNKSLIISSENMGKTIKQVNSLLKLDREIIKSSENLNDKKNIDKIQTDQTYTTIDTKPMQFLKYNSDTTVDTKEIKFEIQFEPDDFDTAIASKPIKSDLHIPVNKSESAICTANVVKNTIKLESLMENSDNQIDTKISDIKQTKSVTKVDTESIKSKIPMETYNSVKKVLPNKRKKIEVIIDKCKSVTTESVVHNNPNKGKALLNSKKILRKSCIKQKSLLKTNRNVMISSDNNQIDTKKLDAEQTESISHSETSQTDVVMDLKSESLGEKKNFDIRILSTRSLINQTDSTIGSKQKKLLTHIETNNSGTNTTEIRCQKMETNQTDSAVDLKLTRLDMPVTINKSDIQIIKKSNPIKGKSLLNSKKNVVKSSVKLKPNSDITQSLVTQIVTKKSDTIISTQITDSARQIETCHTGAQLDSKLRKSEIQMEITSAVTTVDSKLSECVNIECTEPVEVHIQNETSKSETSEYTEPVEVDIQNETSKSETSERTEQVEVDVQNETSKSETSERTEPVEVDIQNETSKSGTTERTEPVEVNIQNETSKSETSERTEPVEVNIQNETSISETSERTEPVEVDIQNERSKSETSERTEPVEVDIQNETSKSETTECTDPVDVGNQRQPNKTDTFVSTEVKVNMHKDTKNSDKVIFKIPKVPVRKIIRNQNSCIAMKSKSTFGRNVLNNSDKIIFKTPNRPVSQADNKSKLWNESVSTKFRNNQIVTNNSDRRKFIPKYSATFIKKRNLKRKMQNFTRSLAKSSKKPKLTGSYSTSVFTNSLDCDKQDTRNSEMPIQEISSAKHDYLLNSNSSVAECSNMATSTESQVNEQFMDEDKQEQIETNEISTDNNILWSTFKDIEIIKKSSETINVDSDLDSNYSVCSLYNEIVRQELFIERPEGYPRIRVRTDLMPKSPNEARQMCGITLLYSSAEEQYVWAVVNVKEFKRKYKDYNIKLLLKKPNFRMDLHRVYRKISKMIIQGTHTLDELKEYLIENLDKIVSEYEMYISLRKMHKEFYESELEATQELAAELEIRRRIQNRNIERTKTIADIKKRSWCRVCQKEANLHCAPAKYYCSVNCVNQDRTNLMGAELSARPNQASTASKRKLENKGEKLPKKTENGRQRVQSRKSGLKIAEVWSLNDQEEQEVVAASETGRIAVLKRNNLNHKTKMKMGKNVSRKRQNKSSKTVENLVANVPATSYKETPRLSIKRVSPSPNVNPLKKMRCDLKNISKLNSPKNKLNLGKVNNDDVMNSTEGTVNVPALIIDFPKNKPSCMNNKSPQKLLLSNIQKQDGQLKNTPLRLYNFQTNSRTTMPKLILNNFKTPNRDINTNRQLLKLTQPKTTPNNLTLRPNNPNQNNIGFNTHNTMPSKSILICKKTDMPSTSGIHRVVMAQDLEKPGPSGLNTKSTRNDTNTTVRYLTKPTSTPMKNLTKPKNTTTIRYPTKPNPQPILPLPTTTQPILRLPTTTQPILQIPTTTQPILQLPTTIPTNIRMPRPIVDSPVTSFNVTNPRKILVNTNPRPMRPRFLFPKPARPDNGKQDQIKSQPMVKTFSPVPPNINQSQQCRNNNQTKIIRAPPVRKTPDIPINVPPLFNNVQGFPDMGKTLIVAKGNTYKLAVPSGRSDNSSKPVYIIKDLPQ